MKIVSNTTPIISLAAIGRLDILEKLFGKGDYCRSGLQRNQSQTRLWL